ncbi:sugar kinase [Psychrosphaera sp. B3R10]|nr:MULTISPECIES: sugar kinase [unclassified Psychrosphaera]MBU2883555.1 sugar kinase [Psychrosphaera sp. I2R16]MBU2989734.1 sugar kinase [Psychrosphaera sp. B3R10]
MKVAIIGECMLELSMQKNGLYKIGYGGDTLNTAVYLSRCGGLCDYFTVIGDDSYSSSMKLDWENSGVGVSKVKVAERNNSGLYLIENDDDGERYFHYWRNHSPARQLLHYYPELFSDLMNYDYVFLTGITLSLYSEDDRQALLGFLKTYRGAGGRVVFDNNYRSNGWVSVEFAITAYQQMMTLTDVALLSLDDEVLMYGEHSAKQCIQRWERAGVTEVVVKNGHRGCMAYVDEQISEIPLERLIQPRDTTAAGDSFNGAYLAARLQSKSVEESVLDGQFCASVVIQHSGAIINEDVNVARGAAHDN